MNQVVQEDRMEQNYYLSMSEPVLLVGRALSIWSLVSISVISPNYLEYWGFFIIWKTVFSLDHSF